MEYESNVWFAIMCMGWQVLVGKVRIIFRMYFLNNLITHKPSLFDIQSKLSTLPAMSQLAKNSAPLDLSFYNKVQSYFQLE